MSYQITTPPNLEPVILADVKKHLVVSHDRDDDLITSYMKAAREQAEEYMGRQIMLATYKLYLDSFSDKLLVFKGGVNAISSISYTDTNGEIQTLDETDYEVDLISQPARIIPVYGTSFPATRKKTNAVVITFTAGYSSADNVPATIRSAIMLIVGHMYENRGDEGHRAIPKQVWSLLDPHMMIYFQ